jgi:hypothetical protein
VGQRTACTCLSVYDATIPSRKMVNLARETQIVVAKLGSRKPQTAFRLS